MSIESQFAEHQYLLQQATLALGTAARAVVLDWESEQRLLGRARRERRLGLCGLPPLIEIDDGPRNHSVNIGIETYSLHLGGRRVLLAHVLGPYSRLTSANLTDFWAVPVDSWKPLYRLLRRIERSQARTSPPVMQPLDLHRLKENTLGFLLRSCQTLRRFGVPQKRGVLLLGSPGNGKTTACRWLYGQAMRRGLAWKTITSQQFDRTESASDMHALFSLDRPGFVLFDDFEKPLLKDASPRERATFLSELDGLHSHQKIVYLFTSNARVADIDPAMRRPGRIDVIMHFPLPDADLRRQYVGGWHEDIVQALIAADALDEVVEKTAGMSFAEVEELRKLLVLHYAECGRWDWPAAWAAFHGGRPAKNERAIGFFASLSGLACDPLPLPAAANSKLRE